MTGRQADLVRRKDDTGLLLIDLELTEDGAIRLGWSDTGPAASNMRGGDVERDLHVKATDVPALCFALLRQSLHGRFDALDRLHKLCADSDIAVEESSWN